MVVTLKELMKYGWSHLKKEARQREKLLKKNSFTPDYTNQIATSIADLLNVKIDDKQMGVMLPFLEQ